jgi:molecular chaperone HscB
MQALQRNHFELFGLPERFGLDAAGLDGAWRALQSAVHPDRHAAASDHQRRLALQLATQVNEAVRTLRDPCRRAQYLCSLRGVSVEAESNTAMPTDFLMRQMDWRERLQEARDAPGGQADEAAIDALRTELRTERERLLTAIGEAIDVRSDFDEAAARVRQLMFVERFGADLDSLDS